ncbi:MAG: hypothetical protein WDN69_37330 [Aliidongia sp.]
MIKTEIKATEASSPYNTFDSVLEIPDGRSLTQNAWLTLQLRVRLNFVDSEESPGRADRSRRAARPLPRTATAISCPGA